VLNVARDLEMTIFEYETSLTHDFRTRLNSENRKSGKYKLSVQRLIASRGASCPLEMTQKNRYWPVQQFIPERSKIVKELRVDVSLNSSEKEQLKQDDPFL